jgi:hypothetical protein
MLAAGGITMTFEREHLKELVECSAAALKVEDDYIEERYQNRPKWRHKRNGLREWTDERYYQSVIWRALLGSKLPWRPETESGGNRHDIAFYDDERGCLVAVVEIKGYWSPAGTETFKIENDIREKLSRPDCAGIMLVLTQHPVNEAEGNCDRLAGELGIADDKKHISGFQTKPWAGQRGECRFDVIGFIVHEQVTTSA